MSDRKSYLDICMDCFSEKEAQTQTFGGELDVSSVIFKKIKQSLAMFLVESGSLKV